VGWGEIKNICVSQSNLTMTLLPFAAIAPSDTKPSNQQIQRAIFKDISLKTWLSILGKRNR